MRYFINPFHKHDVSEFPGVLVPLGQAPHRRSSVTHITHEARRKSEESSEWSHGTTIESLRAEIDGDESAGGVDTAYDRRFTFLESCLLCSLLLLLRFGPTWRCAIQI